MWLGISAGNTAGSARCGSRNIHCSMLFLLANLGSPTINTEHFIRDGFCSTYTISFSSLKVPANCRKISYKDVLNLLWWIVCMLQWSKLQLRPIIFNDLDISCENTQAYTVMSGQATLFCSSSKQMKKLYTTSAEADRAPLFSLNNAYAVPFPVQHPSPWKMKSVPLDASDTYRRKQN